MKSLFGFLQTLAFDIMRETGTNLERDIKYIASRYNDEGLPFLTVTLPSFYDGVLLSIESGFSPSNFPSFKKGRKKGGLPLLFNGLLSKIIMFDGTICHDLEAAQALKAIGQLTCFLKKVKFDCSDVVRRNSIKEYHDIEDELSNIDIPGLPGIKLFENVSKVLWSQVFSSFDVEDLWPKHGPGATSEGYTINYRRMFPTWFTPLEPFFPILGFGLPLGTDPSFLEKFVRFEAESTVRVVTVPKTMKGPRVISVESSAMTFCQQALLSEITQRLEKHPLTRMSINFTSQKHNADRARSSSIDKVFGTIDLKSASDRVSNDLVKIMLSSVPHLSDMVQACRSTKAITELGEVNLTKFASQGSSLCFPIEAMVFYTIIIAFYCRQRGILWPSKNIIRDLSRMILVYGDDIIVPAGDVPSLSAYLEDFGLRVNLHKTFYRSHFRESCGMDAFGGMKVNPTYLRRIPEKGDASALVSCVATTNLLWESGYYRSSTYLLDFCQEVYGVRIPHGNLESPYIGSRASWFYPKKGYCKKTHRYFVNTYVIETATKKDKLHDLFGYFSSLNAKPRISPWLPLDSCPHPVDRNRSVRRHVLRIKHGRVYV